MAKKKMTEAEWLEKQRKEGIEKRIMNIDAGIKKFQEQKKALKKQL